MNQGEVAYQLGKKRSGYASSYSTTDEDTVSRMSGCSDILRTRITKEGDRSVNELANDPGYENSHFFRDFCTDSLYKSKYQVTNEADLARDSTTNDPKAFAKYPHNYPMSFFRSESNFDIKDEQRSKLMASTKSSQPAREPQDISTSDPKQHTFPHQSPLTYKKGGYCTDSQHMSRFDSEPTGHGIQFQNTPVHTKEGAASREFSSLLLQNLQKAKQRQKTKKVVSVQPTCSVFQPLASSATDTFSRPSSSKSASLLSRHSSTKPLPARSRSTTSAKGPMNKIKEIYHGKNTLQPNSDPGPSSREHDAHPLAALKEVGNRARSRSLSSFRGLMRSLSTTRQSYQGMSPAAMALADGDLHNADKKSGFQKSTPTRLKFASMQHKTKAVNVQSNSDARTIIIIGANAGDLQNTLAELAWPRNKENALEIWRTDIQSPHHPRYINSQLMSPSLPRAMAPSRTVTPYQISHLPPPTPPPTAVLPIPARPPIPQRSSRRPRAATLECSPVSARYKESPNNDSMPHLLRMLTEAEHDLLAHRSIL